MKFEEMYDEQKRFSKKVLNCDNTILTTKDLIIHLNGELFEVLDRMQWKMHDPSKKKINKTQITIELVDVYKYFLNFLVLFDIDPTFFEHLFVEKSAVVKYIYETENALRESNNKILLVDLDDTLCDNKTFVINYFNSKYNTNFTEIAEIKRRNFDKYLQMKDELRNSETLKLQMKLNEKIKNEIDIFLANNPDVELVIFTARPVRDYPIQLKVIKKWLKKYNIKYSYIVFTKRFKKDIKFRQLFNLNNIVAIIDDNEIEINQLKNITNVVYNTKEVERGVLNE